MEQAILRFFESIRCVPLTVVFGAFSLLGETMIVAALVILTYWLANAHTGEQIAVSALTSVAFNAAMKEIVARPRPYTGGVVERLDVDNPLLSTRDLGDFLSFPSGHAQMSSNFLTSAALRLRKVWMWIAAPLVVLLVMCSRLYFGVHYPTDLVAGQLFGVLFAVIWELIYRFAYRARYFVLCACAVLALLPPLFFLSKECAQAAGLIGGAAVFLPLTDFFVKPKDAPFPRRLWRVPAGLCVVGAVFAVTLLFPEGLAYSLLKWFLIVGAATLGAQGLFKALKI